MTNVEFRRLAVSEHYFIFRDLQKALQEVGNYIRQLLDLPNLSTQQQAQLSQFSVRYSAIAERIRVVQARGMDCLESDWRLRSST